jgi:hypothetical protein
MNTPVAPELHLNPSDRVVVLCADEKSSPASSDCSNESQAHQASDMLIFVPALSKEGVKRASGGKP